MRIKGNCGNIEVGLRLEFGVISELGKLRKVLMHRPGNEMLNITKDKLSYYRFRDVPDLKIMQNEFDAFANALRDENVQIFLLEDLIEDTTYPNLLFTRDTIAITDIGLIVMNMAIASRLDEAQIAKHALERRIPVAIEIEPPGCLEGGDFVYVDEGTLAVGYGPRTNLAGVTQLTQGLTTSQIEEVVSVPLPRYRVHLDGAFMVVAPELCIVHEPSLSHQMARIASGGQIRSESFLSYLKRKKFDTIPVTTEEAQQFGPNVFAIEPGKVISYDWNTRIISELENHGIEVIPIAGQELTKGAGGPHCMTSPILRDK